MKAKIQLLINLKDEALANILWKSSQISKKIKRTIIA